MRSASEFRQMARETLRGNWKLAMGTGLVASLIGAEIALKELKKDQIVLDIIHGHL